MTPERTLPRAPGRLRARCVAASTRDELEIHHHIRHQVFVVEQGLFD
ncbi:MAG: hypothetical protein QOI99_1610, partial [Actinomycetota bacterium]|nr:hypothetical protein [Actinomycetota bacterium]